MKLQQSEIRGKTVRFPAFLPDATRGVVRSLSSEDLAMSQVEAVVVNTYHLMLNPGLSVLKDFRGVGEFMNFPGLVASDSGGFQIMSLIHQKKTWGKISPEGLVFKWRRAGADEKVFLTPEKSIEIQFALQADIVVCFDYFTDPKAGKAEQELSVALTTEWAARSKEEFRRQLKLRKITGKNQPWLMGVIQGADNYRLRQKSADDLVKIGFDLYGYGGWPMDRQGRFDNGLFEYNASLTPDDKPRFALGVGMPEDIVAGVRYGYQFFDCVLPTRDARHYRLYVFNNKAGERDYDNNFYRFLYINKEKYIRDQRPISEHCGCYTCGHYSRAYLYHLFKIKDALAWRLATLHNLYFYQELVRELRAR